MIKVNAISMNDTQYYNFAEEDRKFIKEIHSVYCYNPGSCTHLCELTPSYELRYLYTYIIFEDNVSDDKRDELQGKYCYEFAEDTYMHCSRVDRLPSVKECGEFEDMEEACEYLRGNCPI